MGKKCRHKFPPLGSTGSKGLIAPCWGGRHVIYPFITQLIRFSRSISAGSSCGIYISFPPHPPGGREALFALLGSMHSFITSLPLQINFSQVRDHSLLSASVVGGLWCNKPVIQLKCPHVKWPISAETGMYPNSLTTGPKFVMYIYCSIAEFQAGVMHANKQAAKPLQWSITSWCNHPNWNTWSVDVRKS